MWTKQKRKSIRGRFILPLLSVAFLSYFSFHAYHGEYGLYSRAQLQEQITTLSGELEKVSEERHALETRVMLLRDGSIEKDMLDEYARRALNVSHVNELTIFVSRSQVKN